MQGLYLVIEGPQGAGKSTQVELLASALNTIGVPLKTFKEPDASTNITTKAIREITQDPKYPLNTKAEVLLYNVSRAISLETIIKYKNMGYVCIVDRSYLSTLVMQYYTNNNGLSYNSIINILAFSVGNNQPDYTIILDAPAQYLHQRQLKRNEHERFDTLGIAKLDKIRAGYLLEAKKRNIPVITATDSPIDVHGKIWQHIKNVLNGTYNKQTQLNLQEKNTSSPKNITKQDVPNSILINNIKVSELLLPIISSLISCKIVNNNNELDYIVPTNLPKNVKQKYIHYIKKIASYNLQINNKLNNNIILQTLPLATLNTINISGTISEYKKLLEQLLLDNSHESTKIYKYIKTKLKNIYPKYFSNNYFINLEKETSIILKLNLNIYKQSNKILSGSYSNNLDHIQLINYSPKNELSLLNNIIFSYTELSNLEIADKLKTTNYKTKSNIFANYVNDNNLKSLSAVYSWEIICSYSNYIKFKQLNCISINNQIITPRYGYDIPKEIEQADAVDEYLECFDSSLELHSLLITNNTAEIEAQYACLKGHKIRFTMQTNITQTLKIIKLYSNSNDTELSNTAKFMVQKISEIHPIVSESIKLD